MTYLFIDTSDHDLIISVIKNMEMIYCFKEKNDKNLSEKIMSIFANCFKETNLNIRDINKIFLVNGPGSFTGIRVGLTLVKTIGFSLNIPVITISRLELLATTSFDKDYIVPLIDARRGYVYAGVYDKNLTAYCQDEHLLFTDLIKNLPNNYVLVSYDDFKAIKPDINILKIIKKHENDESINPHNLKPNYLKKTEAEENLEKND